MDRCRARLVLLPMNIVFFLSILEALDSRTLCYKLIDFIAI